MRFKSFRYFTERSRSRMLYRYIVRVAYRAPLKDRKDLIDWARAEFNSHKNESNPEKIKFLISEGLKRVREMDKMLDQANHR